MWDAEEDNDDAFELRMDSVCREIGDSGKPVLQVAEAVPPQRTLDSAPTSSLASGQAPAPATTTAQADVAPEASPVSRQNPPAAHVSSAPAAPVTPALTTVDLPDRFTPTMHHVVPSQVQEEHGVSTAQITTTSSSLTIFWEQQQRMQTRHEEQLEAQRREAKAEASELRRELETHRKEIERLQAKSRFLAAATRADKVAALQVRLEALHDAKLLEDEALYAIEDRVADAIATAATDDGDHSAWECVVQMIQLSESIASEKAFSRQLRRKFV